MQEIPFKTMVCDSRQGDGGIYFYNDYFEWLNRDTRRGFRVNYSDIKDVKVIMNRKKQVTIITNNGTFVDLYLYRYEELLSIIYSKMDELKKGETSQQADASDDLDKLERLAKLHESGALTDEEFAKAKAKILG
jgi:hypothetical protein